jgi:UDP:flavonoid glycosyltransferase YjiC (YdhE family)
MKILIATVGSYGDVLPNLAIGREMRTRGHEVVFFANPYFGNRVTDAGLRFVPVGSLSEYTGNSGEASQSNPEKAVRSLRYTDICLDYYQAMRAEIVAGQTITISGNPFFWHAPRLLQETDGIPCTAVYLMPCAFRSNLKPARLTSHWLINADTPMLLKRAVWWAVDQFYFEPYFMKPLNKARTQLGLAPAAHIFRSCSWIYEADCVLAMFPAWFAPAQADWPANTVLAGFPFDNSEPAPLPGPLAEFIEAGSAPVAFSVGTAQTGKAMAKSFFETSIAACRLAGIRGILMSHFAEHIPQPLPAGVIHVKYAPYETLLPKLGVFVHHGGIGTLSQALRAGVPQLIRPVAYDQFDNSRRAVQLGVARELLPKQYSARAVADALTYLMSDDHVRQQCREVASRFTGRNTIQMACDTILSRCGATRRELEIDGSSF